MTRVGGSGLGGGYLQASTESIHSAAASAIDRPMKESSAPLMAYLPEDEQRGKGGGGVGEGEEEEGRGVQVGHMERAPRPRAPSARQQELCAGNAGCAVAESAARGGACLRGGAGVAMAGAWARIKVSRPCSRASPPQTPHATEPASDATCARRGEGIHLCALTGHALRALSRCFASI